MPSDSLPEAQGSSQPSVQRQGEGTPACGNSPQPRRWSSSELLANGPLAEIQHGDQVYRLRLTALGKLILTK